MKPLLRVTFAEACAKKARADALAEAVAVAEAWASKGANAASVFMVLAGRAMDAREEASRCVPLDETEVPSKERPPASVSSSGPLDEAEEMGRERRGITVNAGCSSASSSGADGLTASGGPAPLSDNARLIAIADGLGKAITALEDKRVRRAFGGAGKAVAEYLRLIRGVAIGERTVVTVEAVPEPQSLDAWRVNDKPTLRVVK